MAIVLYRRVRFGGGIQFFLICFLSIGKPVYSISMPKKYKSDPPDQPLRNKTFSNKGFPGPIDI